jgi:poly(A) polymerase Pap1
MVCHASPRHPYAVFFSHRPGIGPDADIDTLVVVPQQVERSDFFDVLLEMLKVPLNVPSMPHLSFSGTP